MRLEKQSAPPRGKRIPLVSNKRYETAFPGIYVWEMRRRSAANPLREYGYSIAILKEMAQGCPQAAAATIWKARFALRVHIEQQELILRCSA